MNQLPVTLDFGTLPNNGQGYTPQEFANKLGTNGRVFTEQDFALFTIGATAPTSDTGPWAKDGNSWYYWDSGTGTYVPFEIPAASLGYFVGNATPDPTVYTFWIQLDGSGSPLAIKTYYSGAWVDVYAASIASFLTIAAAAATYAPLASPVLTGTPAAPTAAPGTNTTQLATTAFVTAAIAAIPGVSIVAGQGVFRGVTSGVQNVVFGAGGNQTGTVTLGTESFDPDGCFGSNVFTAPANGYYSFQADLTAAISGGAPTNVDVGVFFNVNGTGSDRLNNEESGGSAGRTLSGAATFFLSASDTVSLGYDITVDAACTVEINPARLSGFRIR